MSENENDIPDEWREWWETHTLTGASARLNRVTRETLQIMAANLQSWMWGAQHWIATHLCGLRFCHSCSGYFRAPPMPLPYKCEACYARDYGSGSEVAE